MTQIFEEFPASSFTESAGPADGPGPRELPPSVAFPVARDPKYWR